jgi:glycine/D-amino acid oxidase-like deaminating enzyme
VADGPKVMVVGIGIVGASIAWHLACRGAGVIVVDAGEPGGIAKRHSWAWINASWGNPEPYFRLRIAAMEEWRRDLSKYKDWAGYEQMGQLNIEGVYRLVQATRRPNQ